MKNFILLNVQSRPGQNSSQLTQTKIRKDFGKQNYYQTPKEVF